jgi:SAM-dependent methyltransferase
VSVSTVRHGELAFHNPLAPARVDDAIARLGLGSDDRVLDIGCGPGELLIRCAEHAGCAGIGVDASEDQIAEARRRAAARVPGARLEFAAADAASFDPGAFTAAACVGSAHALGGTTAVFERVVGARAALIGDGFWTRTPDPAFLEALGATEDELTDLGSLLRAGEPFGLKSVWLATTTREEWERYEWTLVDNGDRFARAHPADPLTRSLLEANERTRARVLAPGGTDTLGFALIVFRATSVTQRP